MEDLSYEAYLKSQEQPTENLQSPEEDLSYEAYAVSQNSPISPEEAIPENPKTVMSKEVINGIEFNVEEVLPSQNYDPNAVQTFATSWAEGSTGGWAGEFAGAVVGGAEWAGTSEDHSFADLSTMYRKHRDTFDNVRIKGEEKFPMLSFGSEFLGGMALGTVTGGTGSVKAAAALGGVVGAGKGEGLDVGDIATGAVLGGVTQGLANKFFPTGAAKAAKATAGEKHAVLEALDINPKGERGLTAAGQKALDELSFRGIKFDQFAEEIIDMPGGLGKIFQPGDGFNQVATRVDDGINVVKHSLESNGLRVDQLASEKGLDKLVDVSSVYSKIESKVLKFMGGLDPVTNNAVLETMKQIRGKPFLSVTESQLIRSELSGTIKKASNGMNQADQLAYQVNKIFRDEMVLGINKLNIPELVTDFIKGSRDYGNLSLVKDLLRTPAANADLTAIGKMQGKFMNHARKMVKAADLKQKGSLILAAGSAIDAVMSDPAAHLAGKRLASLQKIKGAFDAQPGRYDYLAGRLLGAASRSAMFFQKELGYAESVIDLEANPVQRNTNDLMMKLPQVLNIVDDQSPQHAKQLLQAAQSGNEAELGAIMSDLSRLKSAQGLIAKGTGWGGKAVTATDLQEWEAQIKNSGQNHTTRMRQLEQLRKFGTGPVFEDKVDYVKQTIMAKRKNGKKQERY